MSVLGTTRRLGALALLPALLASVIVALTAGAADAALPAVNMERVVLAATLDPARADNTHTAGAAVQDALADLGYLARGSVNGYWGLSTTTAWGKWERHLGENDVWTNNGLPGLDELQQLAPSRFTLTQSYTVGARTKFTTGPRAADGPVVLNQRTINMLNAAEGIHSQPNVHLWQGSYCGLVAGDCASASAGTHRGGGTIDVDISSLNESAAAFASDLASVGFAAWYRSTASPQHVHAVAINDYQMPWAEYGVGGAPSTVTTSSDGTGGNCQILSWRFGGTGYSCPNFLPDPGSGYRLLVIYEDR
jgi:hypothetical protein